MKNHNKKFAVPVITFLALFLSLGASAQMNYAWTNFHLNPVTADRMSNALQTVRGAMEESGTPLYWLAAQSVSGEEHIAVLIPHASYGALGMNWEAALVEHLPQEDLMALGSDLQAAISHAYTERYVGRPDLSYVPETPMNDDFPDAVITIRIDVVPGRQMEFENWARQVAEATAATAPGTYYEMWSPVFSTDDYFVVATIPQWEDLDNPAKPLRQRVMEHFGERRGARMFEESNAWVNGTMTTLYRTRPDISRPPPAQ